MISAGKLDSLKWQSRRGMREIDLMLEPFVNHHVPEMSDEDVKEYENFLNCTDLELVRYLLRHETPTDPRIKRMVDIIVSSHEKDFPNGQNGLES